MNNKLASTRVTLAFLAAGSLMVGSLTGCALPTVQAFEMPDGQKCYGTSANDRNVVQDDYDYQLTAAAVAAHLPKGACFLGDTTVVAQRATPLVKSSEAFNNFAGPLANGAQTGVEAKVGLGQNAVQRASLTMTQTQNAPVTPAGNSGYSSTSWSQPSPGMGSGNSSW